MVNPSCGFASAVLLAIASTISAISVGAQDVPHELRAKRTASSSRPRKVRPNLRLQE